MTMIEGSRHFRTFIIEDDRGDDQIRRYNQGMIATARRLLQTQI